MPRRHHSFMRLRLLPRDARCASAVLLPSHRVSHARPAAVLRLVPARCAAAARAVLCCYRRTGWVMPPHFLKMLPR